MGSLITDRDRHTAMVEMSASVMVNASTSFIQVEEESRTEMFPSDLLADLDLNSSHARWWGPPHWCRRGSSSTVVAMWAGWRTWWSVTSTGADNSASSSSPPPASSQSSSAATR